MQISGEPRTILLHWDGLVLFANDGRIEMGTNAVERSIRPLALNRKNALFAGLDRGAEHWRIVASLIEQPNSMASIPRPISSSHASSMA
jgi:hypothetical protein